MKITDEYFIHQKENTNCFPVGINLWEHFLENFPFNSNKKSVMIIIMSFVFYFST